MAHDGHRFVYFHGMPGGPAEFALFAPPNLQAQTLTPNRNIAGSGSAISSPNLTIVGFSIGAFRAIELAAELGGMVAELHLISPAAPLQFGDFTPRIAGGALFKLAARRPGLFSALARIEGLIARHAPGFLFNRLFATAQSGDAALVCDQAFRSTMTVALRDGLGQNPRAFAEDVLAYVGDWRSTLGKVPQPVTIWQGLDDNWTPSDMSAALAAALPNVVRIERVAGASHYSTLAKALKSIGRTS